MLLTDAKCCQMLASNGRAAVKNCLKSVIKIEDKSITVFKNPKRQKDKKTKRQKDKKTKGQKDKKTKRQARQVKTRLSIGCNPTPKVIEHLRLISQRSIPIS